MLLPIIIFVVVLILIIIGFEREEFGYILSSILFMVLFIITLIAIPISRYQINIRYKEYAVFEQTISEQRLNASPLERVKLTTGIADKNEKICDDKIYSHNIFVGIYYPPIVDTFHYIK